MHIGVMELMFVQTRRRVPFGNVLRAILLTTPVFAIFGNIYGFSYWIYLFPGFPAKVLSIIVLVIGGFVQYKIGMIIERSDPKLKGLGHTVTILSIRPGVFILRSVLEAVGFT